jgi:hypothetical protein
MALNRTTQINVKVSNLGGALQSTTPITLKNQVSEITTIEQIRDVSPVDVQAGATLIYNPANDKYEVRPIDAGDISGSINLDGGEF